MNEDGRTGFGANHLILGDSWWDFTEDLGIEPFDDQALDDEETAAASNSLGKAELVLSILADVVETLAQDIADYKRAEIDRRLSMITRGELNGPNANRALEEIELLKRMRHRLSKQVRWNLPQTQVSGE